MVPADDPCSPTGFNAHTHGFEETWDTLNVQIVMPLPPVVVQGVFHGVADLMKEGVRFEEDKDYDKIAKGLNVRFIKARETGRDVWRMIVPDKAGNTTMAGMAAAESHKNFIDQFTIVPEAAHNPDLN